MHARCADAEAPLPARDEDDGGRNILAPTLDLRGDLRGEVFGDIDDGVVFLCHAVEGGFRLLAVFRDAGVEPEGGGELRLFRAKIARHDLWAERRAPRPLQIGHERIVARALKFRQAPAAVKQFGRELARAVKRRAVCERR